MSCFRRHGRVLVVLLGSWVVAAIALQIAWMTAISPRLQRMSRHRKPLPPPTRGVVEATAFGARAALDVLRTRGSQRYVIVIVKYGLGNRLRALASAMSVAAATSRPLLLVWSRDAHCNCSFADLFEDSALGRFALLDLDGLSSFSEAEFWQAVRREPVAFEAF
jgi:hypothetical protein